MKENEYLLFVIEEKCNSRCNFCCVEGPDGHLVDITEIPMANFKKILKLAPEGKYSGIKFSGGEVTLNAKLPEYASYARKKGFRNIMLQTNARVLSDQRKVRELKAAGVNQYYVSFHAADQEFSDKITGRRGAYAQTVKGLENLDAFGLMVISNTVITSVNYTAVPEIPKFLFKFRNIIEMQFWGYFPLSLKAVEMMPPYALAAPYLNEAVKCVIDGGRQVCVKYFPACLLEESLKKYHNNEQPLTIGVKEEFFARNDAMEYRRYRCCEGTDCRGIPEVYRSSMPPGSWMPPLAVKGSG